MKKNLIKYFVTVLIGLVIVGAVLLIRDVFSVTDTATVFLHLTDAFFIAGVLITSAGALVFTSNQGAWDMLAYGVSSFMDLFRKREKKKYDSFYDYQESKSDKKFSFGFLLICGGVFLAVSMIMLYCHYQAPAPTM